MRFERIPSLLEPLKEGAADLVIGSKRARGLAEVLGYKKVEIKSGLTRRLRDDELRDAQNGFRAYNVRAIRLLRPWEQETAASTEILLKASEGELTLKKVPTRTRIGDSKHNAPTKGLNLNIVKQLSTRRPLLFYGVPGVASLLVGLMFFMWTLEIYAASNTVTNLALIGLGATIVGLILMNTGIILWIVISAVRENKNGKI